MLARFPQLWCPFCGVLAPANAFVFEPLRGGQQRRVGCGRAEAIAELRGSTSARLPGARRWQFPSGASVRLPERRPAIREHSFAIADSAVTRQVLSWDAGVAMLWGSAIRDRVASEERRGTTRGSVSLLTGSMSLGRTLRQACSVVCRAARRGRRPLPGRHQRAELHSGVPFRQVPPTPPKCSILLAVQPIE